MAGYSGTPLVKKLGLRPGDRAAVFKAPPGFTLDLPNGVEVTTGLADRGHRDLVLFFTTERQELERCIDRLGAAIAPDGAAWIAWPKRVAKITTDMTENVVREVALPLGLVDIKVCAIDETWSGLKLVWRKELRNKLGPTAAH